MPICVTMNVHITQKKQQGILYRGLALYAVFTSTRHGNQCSVATLGNATRKVRKKGLCWNYLANTDYRPCRKEKTTLHACILVNALLIIRTLKNTFLNAL